MMAGGGSKEVDETGKEEVVTKTKKQKKNQKGIVIKNLVCSLFDNTC